MRFDTLNSAISEITTMRDKHIVDLNGIMNNSGYIENATGKVVDILLDLTIFDLAINKGMVYKKEFEEMADKQVIEQLKGWQEKLNYATENNIIGGFATPNESIQENITRDSKKWDLSDDKDKIDFTLYYQKCNEIAGICNLKTTDPDKAMIAYEAGKTPLEFMDQFIKSNKV